MLDKLLFLIALAGTAVVFADVLVRDGMLLAPVQRWLREWWNTRQHLAYMHATREQQQAMRGEPVTELDEQWWAKILWLCYKCVVGQWALWGYLIRYHAHYNFFEHIAFTAFTIIVAIILSKWTQEN